MAGPKEAAWEMSPEQEAEDRANEAKARAIKPAGKAGPGEVPNLSELEQMQKIYPTPQAQLDAADRAVKRAKAGRQ